MIKHVLIHYGQSAYMESAIRVSKKFRNDVVLLSDNNIGQYTNDSYKKFEKLYKHMSGNGAQFEILCYLRWFVLYEYMVQENLAKVFYSDSDILLMDNLDKLFTNEGRTSYCVPEFQTDYRWACSGHSSLWTKDGLKSFCDFLINTYENNLSKLEEKWNYHKTNGKPGGICDMTLLYLFSLEYNVNNLLESKEYNGVVSAFDLNINTSENNFKNEYEFISNKKVIESDNGELFFIKGTGEKVKCLTIHCQGGAKGSMSILENKILI